MIVEKQKNKKLHDQINTLTLHNEQLKADLENKELCLKAATANIEKFRQDIEDDKTIIKGLVDTKDEVAKKYLETLNKNKELEKEMKFLRTKLAYVSLIIGKDSMNLFDLAAKRECDNK